MRASCMRVPIITARAMRSLSIAHCAKIPKPGRKRLQNMNPTLEQTVAAMPESSSGQDRRPFTLGLQTSKEPMPKGARKELWEALEHLNHLQRLNLLQDCLSLSKRGNPYIEWEITTGRLLECYYDLVLLITMHRADPEKIIEKAIEHAQGVKRCH